MAEPTGLEPATSDVTGQRSNQLNYDSTKCNADFDINKPTYASLQQSTYPL